MARGFILSSQSRITTVSFITRVRFSPPKSQKLIFMSTPPHFCLRLPPNVTPTRSFCCKYSLVQDQVDMVKYKEAFSKQMALAGLKRHHRIGLFTTLQLFLLVQISFFFYLCMCCKWPELSVTWLILWFEFLHRSVNFLIYMLYCWVLGNFGLGN